jgi:TPR repeat protein
MRLRLLNRIQQIVHARPGCGARSGPKASGGAIGAGIAMKRVSTLVMSLLAGSVFCFAAPAEAGEPWIRFGIELPTGNPGTPGRSDFEALANAPVDAAGNFSNPSKALELVQRSAKQGFAPAEAMLAKCYFEGLLGLPKNDEMAGDLANKSATQGNLDGQALNAWAAFNKASNYFEDLAARGHVTAVQHTLYELTTKLSADSAAKSARAGSVVGEWVYGRMLIESRRIKLAHDPELVGYALVTLAGARGMDDSADVNRLGSRISRNTKAGADAIVGALFWKGIWGVPKNPAQQAKWWQRAADLGDLNAESGLGGLYLDGNGVPRDYAQAMKWSRVAAARGGSDAENNIGAMYARGEGVGVDYAEALKWFRLAARHGSKLAQKNIGIIEAALPAQHASAGGREYAASTVGIPAPQLDGIGDGIGAAFAAELWNSGESDSPDE